MSAEVTESEILSGSSLKDIVSNELERLGTRRAWVWTLFFLCVTPNILNGFHVSSYVFIGHVPTDVWCSIEELENSNWSTEQIRNISAKGLTSNGCTIWNWNYTQLSQMSYEDALLYTRSHAQSSEVSCMHREGSYFKYNEDGTSIVQEWNLVCENSVRRTSAQVLVSLGKFVGATGFGILSDKYGRRTTFTMAAVLFVLSSIITTMSPWFELFLMGRMGLGASASGLFNSAFALLTENIGLKYRSWMSIASNGSYPIGMLILALAAYLVPTWRSLQLTLTIPGFLLILNCYWMFESPRWLLTRNRDADAYKILFKKKVYLQLKNSADCNEDENNEEKQTLIGKIQKSFKEFGTLYGNSRMRRLVLTCYFNWCVTSLCYYVTALNADNLAANRYLYVAITGCVDLPSLVLPVILLKFMGRRTTAFCLYILAGVSLAVVIAIPQENTNWLVFMAMFGRFGVNAVYSVLTLHTAEMFPTEIRSSAIGTSSTMAHVGSMTAPYIVDILGALGWYISTTICGCSVLCAAILVLTLPETSKAGLSNHVNETAEKEDDTANE